MKKCVLPKVILVQLNRDKPGDLFCVNTEDKENNGLCVWKDSYLPTHWWLWRPFWNGHCIAAAYLPGSSGNWKSVRVDILARRLLAAGAANEVSKITRRKGRLPKIGK